MAICRAAAACKNQTSLVAKDFMFTCMDFFVQEIWAVLFTKYPMWIQAGDL